jgi:hypothetical protein
MIDSSIMSIAFIHALESQIVYVTGPWVARSCEGARFCYTIDTKPRPKHSAQTYLVLLHLSYNQLLPFLSEPFPCLFYSASRFTYFSPILNWASALSLRRCSARGSASFSGAVAKVYRPRPRNAIVGKENVYVPTPFYSQTITLLVTPLLGPLTHIPTRQFLACSSPWIGRKQKRKIRHQSESRQNGEPIRFNRQPEGLGTTTTERDTSTGF